MVIDYIENLSFSDGEDYLFDAEMTLARISQGLFWIYENVSKIENQIKFFAQKDNTQFAIINGLIKNIPTDWLSCAFQWYAVSIYNYIRLAGWLSKEENFSINEYIDRVIPKVKNYRHKVAAHFALTNPKNDNESDLISSINTNIVYVNGFLRAGAISEIITDINGNEIKPTHKTSWSLTKTHNRLIPRYWPDGPIKSYQSMKISANSTRKIIVDSED